MLTRTFVCFVVAVLLSGGTPARAQLDDIGELLAMTPSPGVEGLLLAHARDGRVGRRWMQLLSSAEAPIRLAAARGLGVARVRTSAKPLLEALAREQDLEVLGELLQTLAVVAPDDDLPQVYAHLHRLGDERVVPLLDGLTAARPAALAVHLLTAEPLRINDVWVGAVFARLAQASPAAAEQVEMALTKAADPVVLEGVLGGATAARRQLPPALVQAGLRLPPSGRRATITYLATLHGAPTRVPGLGSPAQPAPAEEDPVARWTNELERRWLGDEPAMPLETVIAALPEASWLARTPVVVLRVLSAEERAAFARRFGLSDKGTHALMEASPGEPPAAEPPPALTLLTGFPARVLAEVVRLTKCDPQAADEQLVSVRYHPDRRPAEFSFEGARDSWSPGCYRAAWLALAMSYGPAPRAEHERAHVLVRLDAELTSCLADRHAGSPPAAGSSEWGTAPPRKVKDVRPEYPEVAVRSRLQGVVGVEARIERTGCVSEARVVRPVHPMLDAPAVRAVSRWRYETTTLNGEPVPLVMTVDVTYSLR